MVAIVRELRHRISGNDPPAPVRHHLLATRKAILVARAVRKSMKKLPVLPWNFSETNLAARDRHMIQEVCEATPEENFVLAVLRECG